VRKTRRKVLPLVAGGIVLVAAVAGIALSGVLQPEGAKTCSELLECRNMAAEALANGDTESAIVYLDIFLNQPEDAAHPLGADLWCMRGQANQALGRVPDAIRDYEQCLERSQGDPNMADLRNAAETALAELRGDMGPRCENPDRCAALAERLLGEGRFDEAVAALDRGLEMVPESVHPPNAHLWCLRGDAQTGRRARDEAIRSYETCIGWTEGDPDLEPLRRDADRKLRELRGD
jgi:tetratricopeptide (TPR) repeat protein